MSITTSLTSVATMYLVRGATMSEDKNGKGLKLILRYNADGNSQSGEPVQRVLAMYRGADMEALLPKLNKAWCVQVVLKNIRAQIRYPATEGAEYEAYISAECIDIDILSAEYGKTSEAKMIAAEAIDAAAKPAASAVADVKF